MKNSNMLPQIYFATNRLSTLQIKITTLKTSPSDSGIPFPENTHGVWGNPCLTK